MKNLKIKLLGLLCAVLFVSACDFDVLNRTPLDEISDDAVWGDANLVQLFLNDVYGGMMHGFREVSISSMSDDTHFIHGYGTNDAVLGIVSPGNYGPWGRGDFEHMRWDRLFYKIRQANIFLNRIDEVDVIDAGTRSQLKGEALFLRAYFYHNLLRMFGGVPLITEPFDLDDDMLVHRNTFEETLDFIISDADEAASLLSVQAREAGRATRGAALALKARILTHSASDLFHDSPANELVGFPSGNQQAMWQRARAASQAVMDLGVYSLFDRHDDPVENYKQIFLNDSDHEEIIMSRHFIQSTANGIGARPGIYNGPNGYRNWAGNTPLQSLIDSYEMTDGSAFDWNNPAHAGAIYENRDPRLEASILYDGAQWQEPPSFRAPFEPHGIIQTWNELNLPSGTVTDAVDSRRGPIEDWNGSYSGYYIRKYLSEEVQHHNTTQTIPWRFFRYAEVLLNYAEASMELGDEAAARDAINQVRARVDMPPITDSGQALVDRYRNERRVELFHEEHRYFDIRRWKIAPDVMVDGHGIRITADATDRDDRSTWTNVTYESYIPGGTEGTTLVSPRGWDDSHYFVPIRNTEMQRNENLVQNPGY